MATVWIVDEAIGTEENEYVPLLSIDGIASLTSHYFIAFVVGLYDFVNKPNTISLLIYIVSSWMMDWPLYFESGPISRTPEMKVLGKFLYVFF